MGNRDEIYTLEGMIELDEGYFTVASTEIEKSKGLRGRGASGKQNVAIMAESVPLEDLKTDKTERQPRYFKAKVLETHNAKDINQTIILMKKVLYLQIKVLLMQILLIS